MCKRSHSYWFCFNSDDPIAATILDGKSLNIFLEDEDDFAMLAENLFTDLDVEDRGKISKDEIQSALASMGIESGVPPVSGNAYEILGSS